MMKWISLIVLVLLSLAVRSAQRQEKPTVVANKPPVIAKFESGETVVYTCESQSAFVICIPKARQTVSLAVTASDPENDKLTYQYSVTGGQIFGSGSSVSWKLGDQRLGRYSVTVKVTDEKGAEASSTLQVVVEQCSCEIGEPPCPALQIKISSHNTDPKETFRGETLIFHAIAGMDWFVARPDYKWTVIGGKILKGQNTPWITVEVNGDVGTSVSATVEFEGVEPYCLKTGTSASVPIKN